VTDAKETALSANKKSLTEADSIGFPCWVSTCPDIVPAGR
jgi:hypothetical protein